MLQAFSETPNVKNDFEQFGFNEVALYEIAFYILLFQDKDLLNYCEDYHLGLLKIPLKMFFQQNLFDLMSDSDKPKILNAVCFDLFLIKFLT